VTGPDGRPCWGCVGDSACGEPTEPPEEPTVLARFEAGDSSGGRVKVAMVMFF
jgi:hypothetical protein